MPKIGAWRCRYDYQMASYVVYRGGKRLRDLFPTRLAAQAAVKHLNGGGSIESIPDPEEWHKERSPEAL